MRFTSTRRPVALINADGLVLTITTRPLPVAQAESNR